MVFKISTYGDDYKIVGYKKADPFNNFTHKRSHEEQSDESEREVCNISRAKSRIRELAYCNQWSYFVTLTVSPTAKGLDRYDLCTIVKALGNFIGNQNKKYGCKIKYLLIPEQHKDGAYHMHGLLYDVPAQALAINRNGYLDWLDYNKRFGYCSLSKIKDRKKVANYITKYVTKDVNATAHNKNEHLFYSSRGLAGAVQMDLISVDDGIAYALGLYENDYCLTGVIDNEQLMSIYRLASSSDEIDRVERLIEFKEVTQCVLNG